MIVFFASNHRFREDEQMLFCGEACVVESRTEEWSLVIGELGQILLDG